jgi:hypothetical protein
MHLCELGFDRLAVLAPPGCYLNHSCDPNAMRHGVKVFAWRPIAAGDEITIDYRLNAFDGSSWACVCGAMNCTGTVDGGFRHGRGTPGTPHPSRPWLHPSRVPAPPTHLSQTAGSTSIVGPSGYCQ